MDDDALLGWLLAEGAASDVVIDYAVDPVQEEAYWHLRAARDLAEFRAMDDAVLDALEAE